MSNHLDIANLGHKMNNIYMIEFKMISKFIIISMREFI